MTELIKWTLTLVSNYFFRHKQIDIKAIDQIITLSKEGHDFALEQVYLQHSGALITADTIKFLLTQKKPSEKLLWWQKSGQYLKLTSNNTVLFIGSFNTDEKWTRILLLLSVFIFSILISLLFYFPGLLWLYVWVILIFSLFVISFQEYLKISAARTFSLKYKDIFSTTKPSTTGEENS